MEESLNNPERAGLTNFIGNPDLKPADANLRPFPIQNGDWLILCSDGLFGTLDDEEIAEELFNNPNDASERLVKKTIAKNKSHQDNVTVAILACGDKEPATVRTKKSGREDVFTPLPMKEKQKPFIIIIAAVALIIATSLTVYLMFKSRKEPATKPLMKNLSSSQTHGRQMK